MTLATVVYNGNLSEDGMPEILRCICCEKEITNINEALVLPGRVQTYVGPCCRKNYEAEG